MILFASCERTYYYETYIAASGMDYNKHLGTIPFKAAGDSAAMNLVRGTIMKTFRENTEPSVKPSFFMHPPVYLKIDILDEKEKHIGTVYDRIDDYYKFKFSD
jgi:hypothetical protein